MAHPTAKSSSRPRLQAGLSLIELLIVIALLGILAALALPNVNPGIHDQLQGAAQILATDLAYGRSLAVTNNSRYRFTFDLAGNRYRLEHTGTNAALDSLPPNPFHAPSAAADSFEVDLDELPALSGAVRLAAVGTRGSDPRPQSELEFGPLGGTAQPEETVLWLSAGSGSAERYLWLSVNPVTGLATVNDFRATGPPSAILASGAP